MNDLIASVHEWRQGVHDQTGKNFTVHGNYYVMCSEIGEYFKAVKDFDIMETRDAIGDIAVTAINLLSLLDIDITTFPMADDSLVDTDVVIMSGLIGDALRTTDKDTIKTECFKMLSWCDTVAWDHGTTLQRCLTDVIDILLTRLAQGYTMSDEGTAIKGGPDIESLSS